MPNCLGYSNSITTLFAVTEEQPSTLYHRNLPSFRSENALNVFGPHCAGQIWIWNNQRSFWIVFEETTGREITWSCVTLSFSNWKLRFQIVFRPHENAKAEFSNSSGLKSVSKSSVFCDEYAWTLGLTVEISPTQSARSLRKRRQL